MTTAAPVGGNPNLRRERNWRAWISCE